MKKIIFVIITILLLAACKEKDMNPMYDYLLSENFTPPADFDKKQDGIAYGEINEVSYFSTTTNATRKCNIYTPPGYDPNNTYPVLYLLHGIGGNHTEWMGGAPNEIISNLIAKNEAKPMIVVMPNVRAKKDDSSYGAEGMYGMENIMAFNNFINDLRDDLMPFIKTNYPVTHARNETAIAGLSMGGMESLYIGISMPEAFGYIGAFSAAPSLEILLTADQMTLPAEYKNSTFILLCCGREDSLISSSDTYYQNLKNNGVSVFYYKISGGHDFKVWKNGLYYFTKGIFK